MIGLLFKNRIKNIAFLTFSVLMHLWFIAYFLQKSQQMVLVPHEIVISANLQNLLEEGEKKNKKKGEGSPASAEQKEQFLEKWQELIDNLENAQKIKGASIEEIDDIFDHPDISDSYIYRSRDYEDIMVKDVFPTLNNIDKKFSEVLKKSPAALENYHERNRIIDEFRNDGEVFIHKGIKARVENPQRDSKAPLEFPRKQRQEYFDKTLALGKEAQMKMFMEKYLGYHPDEGDLPHSLRDLYYENLQRIAYTFSSDETYFYLDYFQENLNKEDFLMNSLAIAANLEGSKTAIEILFALDNIYDIQNRALLFLKRFERMAENYPAEKRNRLHYQTMKYLLKRYLPILQEKNLTRQIDISEKYQLKRLEILEYMFGNSPKSYRHKDILFEQAAVYFALSRLHGNQEYFSKAIEIWKNLRKQKSSGDFLNEKAYFQIHELLRSFDPHAVENEIDTILRLRHNEKILEKIEREKRLLYP